MNKVGAPLIMNELEGKLASHQDARPDGEKIKINDHHKAYYSRLWMKNNPAYKGLFNTRGVEGSEI